MAHRHRAVAGLVAALAASFLACSCIQPACAKEQVGAAAAVNGVVTKGSHVWYDPSPPPPSSGCCGHNYQSPPPPSSPPPPYSPPPPSWYSPPPPSWYSPPPPSWYSSPPPPSYSPPWPYYSPPYYPWGTFPYTQECYFDSTGVYRLKPKTLYNVNHDYTRYCFWVEAKPPKYDSHKKCRNFDLWSINFRVHHDCEGQVSDLTFNGAPLSPIWASGLPQGKSMLQVTRGGNKVLDGQAAIADHGAEVCFTLPNYCPLDKFCKGDHCKVAFYPLPYTGLQCCPSWEFWSSPTKW